MFDEAEIAWLMECFNGIVCTSNTIGGNILGHVPYAKEPLPPGLPDKIRQMSDLQKADFIDQVCAWQDYDKSADWLRRLRF